MKCLKCLNQIDEPFKTEYPTMSLGKNHVLEKDEIYMCNKCKTIFKVSYRIPDLNI